MPDFAHVQVHQAMKQLRPRRTARALHLHLHWPPLEQMHLPTLQQTQRVNIPKAKVSLGVPKTVMDRLAEITVPRPLPNGLDCAPKASPAKLHEKGGHPLELHPMKDLDDVGVLQLRQDLDFALHGLCVLTFRGLRALPGAGHLVKVSCRHFTVASAPKTSHNLKLPWNAIQQHSFCLLGRLQLHGQDVKMSLLDFSASCTMFSKLRWLRQHGRPLESRQVK